MNISEATRKALSDALLALVAGAKIKLFQNDFNPDGLTPIGEFDIATFGGYANVDVTTGAQYRDNGTGEWIVTLPVVATFLADNTITDPQTVYGWFLTNTAGSTLLASERLEEPFTFTLEDDGLTLPQISFRIALGVAGT